MDKEKLQFLEVSDGFFTKFIFGQGDVENRKFSHQSGLELVTTRMIDEESSPTEPQRLAL